jgi:hypothetical protein
MISARRVDRVPVAKLPDTFIIEETRGRSLGPGGHKIGHSREMKNKEEKADFTKTPRSIGVKW